MPHGAHLAAGCPSSQPGDSESEVLSAAARLDTLTFLQDLILIHGVSTSRTLPLDLLLEVNGFVSTFVLTTFCHLL
jgi:hypothetical protein